MKIHLLICDKVLENGNITIEAIPDYAGEYLNMLLELEEFYLNEGSPAMTINIPDGTLPRCYNLDVWSIESIKEYLNL